MKTAERGKTLLAGDDACAARTTDSKRQAHSDVVRVVLKGSEENVLDKEQQDEIVNERSRLILGSAREVQLEEHYGQGRNGDQDRMRLSLPSGRI
jgi:hypothetical protein